MSGNQELVMRELVTLDEDKVSQVLDFVRFLKIQSQSDQEVTREFRRALGEARRIAAERGITEDDIAEEIRQVRAEP